MSSQRSTPRWLPPIDVKWIAIAVALSAVTWVLVTPRYLPFQDIPNHVHLLEIDRDLDAPTTYLVRSDIHTLGYSLYIWLSRLSAPLLSASAVLRLLVMMTALATPLAAGAVARALGISAPWAVLLALPLALSWPTRVGLVPYALAIPPALLATAAALRDEGPRRAPWARLLLAFFATLTYLAHAYVFACLCFVLLVAWGTVGAFGRRGLVTAALGIAPGIALSLHDLHQHAFDPIAATAVTLFHAPRWYRPAGLALSHLATRSYAITGPVMLLAFLPLLVLATTAAVAAATGIGDVPRRGGRTFLTLVAVAGSLGTLAIPESQGLVFLLASRTLVIGALFWTLLAAAAADRARGVRALVLALAPLVALGASLTEVSRRARQVEEVVGRNGPERVEGRYLTVQVPDCANASSLVWGGYDSFRHLWAYALGKNGVSPYLFSASRYQPIWYRGDTFREKLRGPPEHPMNENELPLERDACRTVGRERLLSATSWGEYDGVIVTKAGGGLEEALTPDQNRLVAPPRAGHGRRRRPAPFGAYLRRLRDGARARAIGPRMERQRDRRRANRSLERRPHFGGELGDGALRHALRAHLAVQGDHRSIRRRSAQRTRARRGSDSRSLGSSTSLRGAGHRHCRLESAHLHLCQDGQTRGGGRCAGARDARGQSFARAHGRSLRAATRISGGTSAPAIGLGRR